MDIFSFEYLLLLLLAGLIAWILAFFKAKKTFGFFITMGEFGSGKTQNCTGYLIYANPHKEVNITNYYTGYTDFQISSHNDLVNILTDIYDYHQYYNLLPDIHRLYTHKTDHLKPYLQNLALYLERVYTEHDYHIFVKAFIENIPEAEYLSKLPELQKYLTDQGYFFTMPKSIKFNINLDEASIYFDQRGFSKNFTGKNERLLDFVYQPRKLNVLMFIIVQSPMELDVRFRRLATYYRKYYSGLRFYRWYRDFYFMNPEEINLEQAEQVGGGPIFGGFLNLSNPLNGKQLYPVYDYHTKELIRPGEDIYIPGSIHSHLLRVNPKHQVQLHNQNQIKNNNQNTQQGLIGSSHSLPTSQVPETHGAHFSRFPLATLKRILSLRISFTLPNSSQ